MCAVVSGLTFLRSRRWLVCALLLPALALRALVPSGFMPMRDEQGQLSLMFCPGEVPAAALASASADPHAHHHHHHPGGAAAGHTICPFALSAGPALAYSVDVAVVLPQRFDFRPPARPVYPLVQTFLRAQSARGPPHPHLI
jgi:hypothetical protein